MFRLGSFTVFIFILISCSNNENHSRKKFNGYLVESNFIGDTMLDGLTKFYNDKSILQQAEYYSHGIKIGPSLSYHSNGKVYDSVNYINGYKSGYRFVYDSTGQLGRKEYYFLDRKMGPDIFFQGNIITSYDFTAFEKNALYNHVSISLDSQVKRKGELFHCTPYQKYDGDSLNNYVFVYLIRPPKMSITYEIVARNSENKNESHLAYLVNDAFADTLISYSEDRRIFFIKIDFFDSLEQKHQLHYRELVFKQ